MYERSFKRIIDFSAALVGLLILSPLFIIVVLLLLVANRGKIFFTQPRPGRNEKIFRIVKFKTMNDRYDASGQLMPDRLRLTRVGRFVRSTSLDEIPQLINVLKGDMSLVGPRPLLVEYLPLYNDCQKRRHLVRPGITGWAQVNGRNAIGWQKKFEYDLWYVENISFKTDLKIIILTIRKVFKREGINDAQGQTMDFFKGESTL